jgi:hypothetical protein
MAKKNKDMTTALVVGVAALGGYLLLKNKTPGGGGGGGTPGMASWIPAGYNPLDKAALLTYPEAPAFGKYIFVTTTDGQSDTWIQPQALLSFTTGSGEWRVKNYPYPA